MSFVTDPSTINFERAKQEIQAYVQTMPEAERWKDFYAGSAGTVIIQLMAGLKTFLGYQTIVARREAYARTAQNRSSIIGIAQRNGYSAFRGQNARVLVQITPSINETLEPFTVIGSVKDVDLIVLEQAYLVTGVPTTIVCTVGRVIEESKTVQTTGPAAFRYELPRVSEDLKLELNGVQVSTNSRLVMASEGNFIVQTNAVDSVDVFYLNSESFATRYQVGDTLKLTYVERNKPSFVASDIGVDLDGVTETSISALASDEEDKSAIVTSSAIYNETQFVVRARRDYVKIFKAIRPALLATGYRNVSPSVVELFYIRNDDLFYSNDEEATILQELMLYRGMGLQPPTMGKSTKIPMKLNAKVTLLKPVNGILTIVDDLVKQYQKQFEMALDLALIENQIEDVDGVKIARISIASNPWAANERHELGSYVKATADNGRIYRLIEFKYPSGSSEPAWPTTEGDTVVDGDIVWRCKYLERQCDVLNPQMPIIPPRGIWQPETHYKIGQIVIPSTLDIFEYEAIEQLNRSSGTEPTWPALAGGEPEDVTGQTVADGDLIWIARPLEGDTPNAWSANTVYKKGDLVIATDPDASDSVGMMYQVVAYTAETDATQPTWPTTLRDTVDETNMVWECLDPNESPDPLKGDQYYILTTSITIT